MFGVTQRAEGGRPPRRYYRCSGKDCTCSARERRCPQRMAEAATLEAAVWGHVQGLLSDPEALLAQFRDTGQGRRRGRCDAAGGGPEARGPAQATGARGGPTDRRLSGRGDQPGRTGPAASGLSRAASGPDRAARSAGPAPPGGVERPGGAGGPDDVLRPDPFPTGQGDAGGEAGDLAVADRARDRGRGGIGDPPCHPATRPAADRIESRAAQGRIAPGWCGPSTAAPSSCPRPAASPSRTPTPRRRSPGSARPPAHGPSRPGAAPSTTARSPGSRRPMAISSFFPSAVAPIRTRMHWRPPSRRMLKWTPSAQT